MFRKYLALERSKTSLLSTSSKDNGTNNGEILNNDMSADKTLTSSNLPAVGKTIGQTQSNADGTGYENIDRTPSDETHSESSTEDIVQNWTSVVENVTTKTSKILNNLKEIDWKGTDGTYMEDVTNALCLLKDNLFVLEDECAPVQCILQSRTEIADAIADADIVPKICGMVFDLYEQWTVLSEKHKSNYMIAEILIDHCVFASKEFISRVSSCPRIFEFLKEQLTSSSESYQQGTSLDMRLTRFMKILEQLLKFYTDLTHLRTLNITDVMKPYLTAPNNRMQISAINILARICIAENALVNESNEHSSQGHTKTQNLAYDWSNIIKRLSQLLSDVLESFDGTEWKDACGSYKAEIISLLNFIVDFHYVLKRQRVPVEHLENATFNAARVLIDANSVPKLCGVLMDLHQNTLEITDNGGSSEALSFTVCGILWNYTDSSVDFAEEVANTPGFLAFTTEKLASYDPKANEKNVSVVNTVISLINIVYNISRADSCKRLLRDVNIIEVLRPYLKLTSPDRLVALAALAGIIDEEESELIKSNEQNVAALMDNLRLGLQSPNRRSISRWSCKECAKAIRVLARNDANKRLLVQLGALELLVKLTKGNEEEQTEAVQAIWALSFDENNRAVMVQDDKLDLISILDKMRDSENRLISKAAHGTIWNLRHLLQNSKVEKFRNIVKSTITVEKSTSLQGVASKVKHGGHVMISYQWSHQKTLLMVKEELVKHGFKVWMDVEKMMGSIAQAMAEAVENADIVLICLSHKYKNSEPCRQELEYANLLKKKIVPLQLEEGYRPDGWLGIIARRLKYYDFSGHRPIESEMKDLLIALKKMKDDFFAASNEISVQSKPPDFVDGPRAHGSIAVPHAAKANNRARPTTGNSVRQWTNEDVKTWMDTNQLPRETFGNLTAKGIALLLRMRNEAPEAFYRYLQETWHCDLDTLSNLVWAMDTIRI